MRPASDILDRGKKAAPSRLQYYRNHGMEYAVFVCGVLYERFAPGGMGAFQIGHGTYVAGEGDYLMDIRNMTAQIPYYDSAGQEVHICMTSAQDVARFVVAALDLSEWPSEFRMRGERMALSDVVRVAEITRGELMHLIRRQKLLMLRISVQVSRSTGSFTPRNLFKAASPLRKLSAACRNSGACISCSLP